MSHSTSPRNVLLMCGTVMGPLFYLVVVLQLFTRVGFDIRRHPLSLLSLGDSGWIQVCNFIVAGLLALAGAVGVRRRMRGGSGGVWLPGLIGTYGIGMITAGLFPPDAYLGFPPGTPLITPTTLSKDAMLHGLGFFVAFSSLTAACFIFAKRYASLGQPRWATFSIATGLATPALIVSGVLVQAEISIFFMLVGIVAFGWLSLVTAELSRTPGVTQPALR